MEFIEVLENEKLEYNHFVASHGGSFLQSWEWGMWQEKLGKKISRFKIVNKDKVQTGSIQLIFMALPFGRFYLYAPYGPVMVSGFRLQAEDLKNLLAGRFSQAMFVRIEPQDALCFEFKHPSIVKSINIQPALTMVVDINKNDNELLSCMHGKTRYNIRLAQKHGVSIQSELAVTPAFGLYAKEAVDLIVQTQIRQNYRGHAREYYKQLLDFFMFLENGKSALTFTIYKALYKKQILASAIMADFGKTRVYLYGGSATILTNLKGPNLLHYVAMLDARAKGLCRYDLGGSEVSSGGERGFTRFKQGFGGREIVFAGAYDYVTDFFGYRVYSLLRNLNLYFRKIF